MPKVVVRAFSAVNIKGKYVWMNYQIKTEQGIRNLTREEVARKKSEDPDHATRDLYQAIERGEYPAWTVYVQIMTPEQAGGYRFDTFDITKVWFHGDFPLIPVGRIVLNRNPKNYFAEVEQAALQLWRPCT